jgi:hypothetical protein
MIEWAANLLRNWEVLRSNLSPETGYPDWAFSLFSSAPHQAMPGLYFNLGHYRFLLPFKLIYLVITNPFSYVK